MKPQDKRIVNRIFWLEVVGVLVVLGLLTLFNIGSLPEKMIIVLLCLIYWRVGNDITK